MHAAPLSCMVFLDEVFRLQNRLVEGLESERYTPLVFPEGNRSGILAVVCGNDLARIVEALAEKGVVCSGRGGYLRLAPHYCITDEEIDRAVRVLNRLDA